MNDPREHMDQIYITGSRSNGKRSYLLMACSRCGNPDLVTDGIAAAHVIAAAYAHIERTEKGAA